MTLTGSTRSPQFWGLLLERPGNLTGPKSYFELYWTELNFIDNNIYIITKLLAPATSKMTNRGGGKGYTFTTREKLNTTN